MENKKSERDLKLIRFPIICYQYEKLSICNYNQCCYAHTYDEIIFCKEQIKLSGTPLAMHIKGSSAAAVVQLQCAYKCK